MTGIVDVMSAKFEVEQDEQGRWRVVDVEHAPHRYRTVIPYETREEAEARAERYNLIMSE